MSRQPCLRVRRPLDTVAGLPGFVRAWEAAGPLDTWQEAEQAATSAGAEVAWRPLRIAYGFALDLGQDRGAGFAAATTRLDLEKPQQARMALGGYDGFQVWVNGHAALTCRGKAAAGIDDCCVDVNLRAGENAIALCCDLARLSKAFAVRVTRPDGGSLEGAEVVLPDSAGSEFPDPGLSTYEYFRRLLNEKPALLFEGAAQEEWQQWRERFLAQVVSLLGPKPERCALEAAVTETVDCGDYLRERVVYWSEPGVAVPAYVLVPKSPRPPGGFPALLCLHGHGNGKSDVIGLAADDQAAALIQQLNYDYAPRYARKGYLTITPDTRGFGERADPAMGGSRDNCDAAFVRAVLCGRVYLGLHVWDLERTVDYLVQRPDVDPERIGCMGLSWGGRCTTFLSALDQRIKAAVISGVLNTFRERVLQNLSCGAQFIPGLFQYGDNPELIGLIAPRPLLVELGMDDPCCPEVFASDAYARVRRVYRAAGAEDRLDCDVFEGGHRFREGKSLGWFDRWL